MIPNEPWKHTKYIGAVMAQAVYDMNAHINTHGKIERSSQVIKNWHEYDNVIWRCILAGAQILEDEANLMLRGYAEADIEFLWNHIEQYETYHDNLLYPTPNDTKRMPDSLSHNNPQKHQKTIKQRTFRLMMEIRDKLCGDMKNPGILGWSLANDDTSKGKLDPTPFERLTRARQ